MCVEWLVAVNIAVFAVFVLCDKKRQKNWWYQEYCLLLHEKGSISAIQASLIALDLHFFALELEQTEKNGCDEGSNE